ncbi:RNA-binding protein 28 [Sander lucioperca]|uniref:RNA-binding protein 28 n=1 Tax=Sander lucioperca TaxID=283035 RepID=UPI001653CD99|nr:RNA-binding protein 28 [Sander lucioperca]XP_035859157.1 RNA-binding protein 28 [Sander lucioperca]
MPTQTIFVSSLPASATNERLEEIFSEIGPVKQCFVVREKGTEKCRGFGYVTYSMQEDAQRAMKEIKDYDGKKLSISVAKKKINDKRKTAPEKPAAAPKGNEQKSKGFRKTHLKARLIIRNLSFKCSEDDLKQVLSEFGTVLEANIPLKPDGKMRGFAFVLFKNVSEAAIALKAMNLKEIKGRQVAIDWAVPKDKFIATQLSSSPGNKNTEATAKQSDIKSDDEEEDEEKPQTAPKKKKVPSKPAAQQVEESQSDDSGEQDSEEEEEDDDDDDDDDDDEREDDDVSQEGDDDDDKSSLESNDDPDESQDEEEDEEDEDGKEDDSAKKKASKKLLPSDVKEGRTIFIRNLSFDTEEDGLEEVLLKYGELNYIKVVLHTDTGHSKGCAFAQFKTKVAADKCIAAAQDEAENGGIRVDGRKLLIVSAVSREDASKLKVNKVKVETGTRNLYLAREGLIRAGTKAAEGVPEADMIKRTRFEEIKRTKLRDISVFVSKTRLCVHNLPKSADSKKLKALCLQAVKGSKGVRITECRVMYDKKPEKNQVMGQSLGYGFVQFQDHEHALSTLRYLNNNPDIFGPLKRPIVEFSLEDSRKLKIKELRHQKNMEFFKNRPFKGGSKPQPQTAGDGKGPRNGGNEAQSSSEQTGTERAPSQSQKQGSRYLGFQTKPEVEHVDLENGKKRKKVLTFPTHRGPKIRMRDKGKQQAPPPKKARPGSNRKDRQRQQMEKPTRPRNQVNAAKKQFKRRDGDRFDSLVEQYKKKLMGNRDKSTNVKRNKWFDS